MQTHSVIHLHTPTWIFLFIKNILRRLKIFYFVPDNIGDNSNSNLYNILIAVNLHINKHIKILKFRIS